MALYNDFYPYNAPDLSYAGLAVVTLSGETLCYNMNRLAGTIVGGVPQYDTSGAAQIWVRNAGVTPYSGIALAGLLNILYASRNGGVNYGWDTLGALNGLAGTTGLGMNEASDRIPS